MFHESWFSGDIVFTSVKHTYLGAIYQMSYFVIHLKYFLFCVWVRNIDFMSKQWRSLLNLPPQCQKNEAMWLRSNGCLAYLYPYHILSISKWICLLAEWEFWRNLVSGYNIYLIVVSGRKGLYIKMRDNLTTFTKKKKFVIGMRYNTISNVTIIFCYCNVYISVTFNIICYHLLWQEMQEMHLINKDIKDINLSPIL